MSRKNDNIIEKKYNGEICGYEVKVEKDGKCYTKYFGIKKYKGKKVALENAKLYRNQLINELNSAGEVKKTPCLTLKEAFEEMLDYDSCVISTAKKMKGNFNKYICKVIPADKLFSEIKTTDIQKTLNLMADCASADTIDRTLSVWRKMYKYCIGSDIVTKDCTINVIKPKSNYVVKSKPQTSTLDTVETIMNEFKTRMYNRREGNLAAYSLLIMYHTGMREQEVFALSVNDININNRIIHIRKSVGTTKTSMNAIKNTKTLSSVRDLQMVDELVEPFQYLIDHAVNNQLFLRDNGQLMTGNWLSDRIRYYRPKGSQFTAYANRHQLATDLINDGVSLRTVQDIFGHASPKMTLSYARSNQAQMCDALINRGKARN